MSGQLSSAITLIRAGHWRDVANAGRTFISSESTSFELRRNVTNPFPVPAAKVPISVRPIAPADVLRLLTESDEALSGDALKERNIRVRMADAGLATCYVAVTNGDEPTYIQWLLGASEKRQDSRDLRHPLPGFGQQRNALGRRVHIRSVARQRDHGLCHGSDHRPSSQLRREKCDYLCRRGQHSVAQRVQPLRLRTQ